MMKKMGSLVLAFWMVAVVFSVGVYAEEEAPNYILDVKVGEWVQHKMQGGMVLKQTVLAVNEKEATVKTETFMDGKSLFSSEIKIPLKAEVDESEAPKEAEQDKAAKPVVSHGKVTVDGKQFNCTIVEYPTSKMYMSQDVPLTGMVKIESEGKVVMELMDYGTDGK